GRCSPVDRITACSSMCAEISSTGAYWEAFVMLAGYRPARPGRGGPPGRAMRWSEGRGPTPGGPGSSVVFAARPDERSPQRRATSHVRQEITSRITSCPVCLHRRGGRGTGQRNYRSDARMAGGPRARDIAVPSRSLPVQTILTDSLEKVLGEDAPRPAALIGGAHASGFLGEVLSLQLALRLESDDPAQLRIALSGDVAGSARVHAVRRVPVSSPAPADPDEHYLVTEPGEYPDLLEPLPDGVVSVDRGIWEALWIDVADAPPGEHDLTLTLSAAEGGEVLAEQVLRLRVHAHRLPPLTITNTHWFHADSLSTHYEVEVFSERHWELIEAFLASAREMDVTSVLTPVWTPPLDTAEGHTRPFVQLVGIREEGGEYSFDLTQLDRWLALCRRLGFTGIEIAHLFTQWGAQHTPAIQVETADGL